MFSLSTAHIAQIGFHTINNDEITFETFVIVSSYAKQTISIMTFTPQMQRDFVMKFNHKLFC